MKTLSRSALALPILLATPAAAQEAAPLLHPMFQDHGVLQRDRPIPVWGDAPAGERIEVTLAGRKVRTRAGKDGQRFGRAQVYQILQCVSSQTSHYLTFC